MEQQLAELSAQVEQLVQQLQSEGVLDEQFSQLLALQDESNPDFVAEVVQLYFQDSVGKIEKIQQLLSVPAPNFHELDQVVHQFKGSSASLGAHAMAQLCIKLREGCQTQDAAACVALTQQVMAAYSTLRGRLEGYLHLEAQRKQILEAAAAAGSGGGMG
jgi:histidine-containing phosphotransfer protein